MVKKKELHFENNWDVRAKYCVGDSTRVQVSALATADPRADEKSRSHFGSGYPVGVCPDKLFACALRRGGTMPAAATVLRRYDAA
jgi:hypothetical protein